MALKNFKPTTPGQRQLVIVDRSGLHRGKPVGLDFFDLGQLFRERIASSRVGLVFRLFLDLGIEVLQDIAVIDLAHVVVVAEQVGCAQDRGVRDLVVEIENGERPHVEVAALHGRQFRALLEERCAMVGFEVEAVAKAGAEGIAQRGGADVGFRHGVGIDQLDLVGGIGSRGGQR